MSLRKASVRVKLVVAVGAVLLTGFAAANICGVQFAYRVTYEGKTVGYVESADSLSAIEGAALSGIKAEGADSYLDKAELSLSLTVGSKINSAETVAENILAEEDSLTKVSVLMVDGKPAFAVCENPELLENGLSYRLNAFTADDVEEVSFVSKLEVVEGYVPHSAVVDYSQAGKYICCADVKTVKTEAYIDEIPYGTEKTESNDYLKGYVKITSAGVPGQADVVAKVTCVNGIETERNIIKSTTITEPVAQKQLVGTATVSKTSSTKYASSNSKFMWPLDKSARTTITSYMGDGRGHKGIDIACAKGTEIYASMGGTVAYAHYRSDYGNFVVIDHGNGYRTVYAHASKLLVTKGQVVEKGETIALVGSTGQSTGNHLHFEVRINDVAVNPLSYVKK
ncbi:MAG: hypothetical protein E7550_01500 [Ruminococcaceae bacterium]|nr:hypothetical protein [Oscillospiraceae bacterium]